MKKTFSFSIRRKITLALAIIIFLLVGNGLIGVSINRNVKLYSTVLNEVYKPLVDKLDYFNEVEQTIVKITGEWLYDRQLEKKQILNKKVKVEYPQIRLSIGQIISLLKNKPLENDINNLISKHDALINFEKELLEMLTSQADFENQNSIDYCMNLYNKSILSLAESNQSELNEIKMALNSYSVNLEEKINKKTKQFNLLSYIVITLVSVAVVFIFISITRFSSRLKKVENNIAKIAKGDLSGSEKLSGNDEPKSISDVVEVLLENLQRLKKFTIAMGKGDYKADISQLHKWGEIGDSLETMQKRLGTIAEEQQKRREEEELNAWKTTGLAHFNEILRLKNNNVEELSYDIIKELVKYVDAVIGGVYISKKDLDGNEKLEMMSLFAYDRKRYVEKEIEVGEGLIGTCYVEKHKILLRDVPEDYVKISSGLGEAKPNELLIVPLKHNDDIHGVVELATLGEFPDYMVDFVEKIAEGFASTISAVIINSETARLLRESNEKAEMLHSQEEELRQNMEELQAAQEERDRQADHVSGTQKYLEEVIVNIPFPVFVKDQNRQYTMVNSAQAALFDKSVEQLIGKSDADFISDEEEIESINKSDDKVLVDKERVDLPSQKLTMLNGQTKILKTIKVPLHNSVSQQMNILGISYYI